MSGKKYQTEDARKALVEVFGRDALPAVDAAIREALDKGDSTKASRLEDAKSDLAQLPETE